MQFHDQGGFKMVPNKMCQKEVQSTKK